MKTLVKFVLVAVAILAPIAIANALCALILPNPFLTTVFIVLAFIGLGTLISKTLQELAEAE